MNININRPSLSQGKFQEIYGIRKANERTITRMKKWCYNNLSCSTKRAWRIFTSYLPVLIWLPEYKRKYFAGDLVAGWTVGIIRIPQGMAYALLAGVQPVYGLYSCFFPVLLWFFLSTSHHTSVGTMAVVCLMIQNLIASHVPELEITQSSDKLIVNGNEVLVNEVSSGYITVNDHNISVLDKSSYIAYLHQEYETEKINIACSATLLVGIIQLVMSFFRLGFLTTLLSDPVIQGFTTGAAFHVMTSQVKYLFGLDKSIEKYNGPFAIFKTLADICGNLYHANVPDIIISVISLPSLLVVKVINERYKKKLRNIPIPIELILVVLATVVSYFCHFDKEPFNVNTVKTIPTGMPSVKSPGYVSLWGSMFSDCLIMAFVSVAISLSLTKIFADKHGYETDANQEIFALGVCNTIPAFLSSFAVAASLSRTAIQESTGGKTQLVAVLSSVLMLIVLLWLAPLFEPVPKSVLACIIVVALKSLFYQFQNLKPLWQISKFDTLVWLVTCFAVIILGVDVGLAAGVAMAIAGLLYRIQHPRHALLGRIIHTDIYENTAKYKDAMELTGIKIFHFSDSVSFTNINGFRNSLYGIIGCNPSHLIGKLKKHNRNKSQDQESRQLINNEYVTSKFGTRKNNTGNAQDLGELSGDKAQIESSSLLGFSILILDATMWSFVDWTASKEILQIIDKFKQLDITVLLAGPTRDVLLTLDNCGLTTRLSHEQVFVTVHDAAVHAERLIHAKLKRSDSYDSIADLPGYPGYDSLAL